MWTWIALVGLAAAQPTTLTELTLEAWRRVETGDYEGVALITDEIRARGSVTSAELEEAAYVDAAALDLWGRDLEAAEAFHQLIENWPDGNRRYDAVFRMALTLAEAGEHKDGLKALKQLKHTKRFSRDDQLKIALVRGVMFLRSKKTRKGLKTLVKTLDDASSAEVVWYQAWARTAMVDELLNVANHLEFDGPEKTWSKVLSQRSESIVTAEAQFSETVNLAVADAIIVQLRMLGDAYTDFGDDLQQSPIPEYLGEEQRAAYRDQIGEYVETTWVKGSRYYELGLDHAARTGWVGPEVDLIELRYTQVNDRVESLE